jgi:hypothetical protein
MEPYCTEPTKSTPLIRLDPNAHVLAFKGECYPENAARFFGPVFSWLKEYLASEDTPDILVNMEMIYFNSSSSKAFMNFFEMLEEAALNGKDIVVNWRYHEENESALEAGEEFGEEVPALTFNLVEISAEGTD